MSLNVGMLGTGGIATYHLAGFEACADRARIAAVADINEDAARAFGKAAGAERIYSRWQDLIEDDAIDAVDISLPHDLHAEVAVAAAEAGKHILVEKPIATTLEDADRMLAAAERAGVTLAVLHDRRFSPSYELAKQLLDDGVIGRPLLYRLDHNQAPSFPEGSWARSRERLGGGAIMSCLTHIIDLARHYAGDVADVGCWSVTLPEKMEGEIIGVVPMRFASGAIGDLSINWNVKGRKSNNGTWYEMVWISGTEGTLYTFNDGERHSFGGVRYLRYGEEGDPFEFIPVENKLTGHQRAIIDFVDSVLNGTQPLVTGAEGRAAIEVALAAYEAEREGRVITLPRR